MYSPVSVTVAPASAGTASNVTPSSETWTASNSSLDPVISTAAYPVFPSGRERYPPAFEEASPSVSGETAVALARPVKLITDACTGPVERNSEFAGPSGSASKGTRSCASRTLTPRPPMNSSSTSSMSVVSTLRSLTSTVRSGPSMWSMGPRRTDDNIYLPTAVGDSHRSPDL